MSWFKKILPARVKPNGDKKKGVPEGLWTKCKLCQAVLLRTDLTRNLEVCPKCQHHHRITPRNRLNALLDEGTQQELATEIKTMDRLKFRDSKRYKDRIAAAQRATDETEALIVVQGSLQHIPVVVVCFDFAFMGGSMGSVVGEKFVRAVMQSMDQEMPLICFAASGGARMQEGLFSLMQMAKTSAALAKLDRKKLPYVSVLTDPTMGGVSASLAMLGDIIIAEPKALIGFAGPRVIEQTVRQTLPEGFQRSEFLLEHGHIDMIVNRLAMRETVAGLLKKLTFN